MSTSGEVIRERRLKLGISQEQLASAAALASRTVGNIENDRHTRRGRSLIVVEQTLDDLESGGHGSKSPEPGVREFGKFWNAVMASLYKHAEGMTFDQRNVIASQAWFELHPEMRPTDGGPTDAVIFVRRTEGAGRD